MKVAIIPARGGSKRIPRKNIKLFCGKPMIAHSIVTAQESKIFDRIVVSTDDQEIVDIAIEYGAEVPFIRPTELADDFATTAVVIKHAIEELQKSTKIDYVCCIYATAPFVLSEDLQNSYEVLKGSKADYVFSATSFPFPIQRAFKLLSENRVEMFEPEHILTRSQDLEEAYHDAGQFYWGPIDSFLQKKPFFSKSSRAHLLPRHRVQDIDTFEDWQRAEFMYRALESIGEQ